MGDYLLCHAAFVLPAAFACYHTDGDLKKLKGNTAYLSRMLDANIEGYRAIRNAGHAILPKEDTDFEGAAYRKTCLRFFRLICATSLGKICVSDHAMNAVEVSRELKFLKKVGFRGKDPARSESRTGLSESDGALPFWYARGDLNPYPCGMEPKSIVSANFTTGAFGGIIP